MERDFLHIGPLDENGNFSIPLPFGASQRSLVVEVKYLHTYQPLPEQPDPELTSPVIKDPARVRKMQVEPKNLPSNNYNVLKYTSFLGSDPADKVKDWFEQMGDVYRMGYEKIIDPDKINCVYTEMSSFDVVIFMEYGMYYNKPARIKSVSASNRTGVEKAGYGCCAFTCQVYGFNVGFKFNSSETVPDLTTTYSFTKLVNELLDTQSDCGINDMIRFALLDFGNYQLFKVPELGSTTINREGYGFMVIFNELDTYLCCTVTAGRLPYVLTDFSVTGRDSDYSDLEFKQNCMILRKTRSILVPEKNEYSLNICTCPYNRWNRYPRNKDGTFIDNQYIDVSDLRIKEYLLNNDYIFDCAMISEPIFDITRSGLSLMLPIYGGFNVWYSAFFYYLYYGCHWNIPVEECFITSNSLMYFWAGTDFGMKVSHFLNPHERSEKKFEGIIYNLVNPLYNLEFDRIVTVACRRKREFNDRINELRRGGFFVVGLNLEFAGAKFILGKDKYYEYPLIQTYSQSVEEYPGPENKINGRFSFPAIPRRPIVIEDGFSFTHTPFTTVILKNEMRFQFVGLDINAEVKPMKFAKGDKIMVKGKFIAKHI